jgi:O-antigen/teichoic acid export membrane protein
MILGFTREANRTKVAYNTAAQLAAKFLSAGTTFIVSFYLAREYGATSFGDFIKVTTFVGLFFLATDFGLNAQWLKEKIPWHTLVVTRLVLSLLFMGIAPVVVGFLPSGVNGGYTPLVRLGVYLFLPAIFFQSLLTSANAVFQKTLRYDLSTVALAAGVIVVLAALVGFARVGIEGSLVGVMAMLGGIMVTGFVASLFAARLAPQSPRATPLATGGRRLLVTSIPLGLTLLFTVVYGHVDSIILASTRPTAEVGFYGFAYKIFEFALAIPTFFMNAAYPLLLKATSTSARFARMFRKSLTGLVLLSFVFLVGFWMGAPLIALVRSEFAASVPALRVLSLSLPVFFISALFMWTLIALGRQRSLVWVYGISMLLNIVFNLYFVPTHGYMAAAWVTVVSEVVVLVWLAVLLRGTINSKL